jgi:8-oxo-dGTP pyrophosphatase MutT (NUDIX family)
MSRDRPGPGEELADGPPATPRQAATVILVRGGAAALEVLLVQRSPAQRFMGGAWVFPGGAVDAHEGDGGRRPPPRGRP